MTRRHVAGGIDFYKKAFIDLDESALEVGYDEEELRQSGEATDYLDPNYAGRDWNLATAMVIKGNARHAVDGRLGEGRVPQGGPEAGHRLSSAFASRARRAPLPSIPTSS